MVVAVQTAGALERQENGVLPPAFMQKAEGPMAKADTALRRLIGEFLAHRKGAIRTPSHRATYTFNMRLDAW